MDAVDQAGDPPGDRLLEPGDYQAAADRALDRYPGPLGALVHRELSAYATFGRRFATGHDTLIPCLTTEILRGPGTPPPTGTADPSAATSAPRWTVPGAGPTLWPRPGRR